MVVGGGPLGGIVTYEVGQQAFESEGAFDLLALIDTRNPAAESDDDMDDLHPTLLRYAPRAYQGPVTLFRRSAQARLHQLGWDGLVRGGMTVIQTEDMEDLAMKFRSVVTQQPNTFELS